MKRIASVLSLVVCGICSMQVSNAQVLKAFSVIVTPAHNSWTGSAPGSTINIPCSAKYTVAVYDVNTAGTYNFVADLVLSAGGEVVQEKNNEGFTLVIDEMNRNAFADRWIATTTPHLVQLGIHYLEFVSNITVTNPGIFSPDHTAAEARSTLGILGLWLPFP